MSWSKFSVNVMISSGVQKTFLQEETEECGDQVIIYGVKFHPELAPIEVGYLSFAETIRISNTSGCSA